MHIYITSLVLILVLGLLLGITRPNTRLSALKSNNRDLNQKFFIIVSSMVLISLRFFVDIHSVPDLYAYSLGYEQITKKDLNDIAFGAIYDVKMPEIGFRFFMKFVSYLSNSFSFFLLIFGWIWFCLYYRLIKTYSPYIILSIILLALGGYSQSLFVLRQHMAMAITFCAFPYIIQQDLKKYVIALTIAFAFHQTALISIPLYFLYSIKSNNKLILSLVVVSIAAFFLFASLLSYFGLSLLLGYESYIAADVGTNATGALISLCNLSAYVYFLRKRVFDEGINRLLFICCFLSTVLNFIGIGYGPTSRLLMYFSSIEFLLIPVIVRYINNRWIRNIYISAIIVLMLYMCFYGSGSLSIQKISFSFFS